MMRFTSIFLISLIFILSCQSNKNTDKSDQVKSLSAVFVTKHDTVRNVDSPAIWHGGPDQHWLLTTAKSTNTILINDAVSGELIAELGTSETYADLARPNGIAVINDYMFVVERDNHRVQIFKLPSLESVGQFGSSELIWPYGIVFYEVTDDTFMVYITDDYPVADEEKDLTTNYSNRVKHFTLSFKEGSFNAVFKGAFGDSTKQGLLEVVESIAVDPENHNLVIADEQTKNLKVYDTEGNFTGKTFGDGRFTGEPEGIVLITNGASDGYWICTDQHDVTNRFMVFDRKDFRYVGAFECPAIKNTDGIAVTQSAFEPFTKGAFYAVHDDGSIGAIDMRSIIKALGLKAE